jgi:predicted ATPase
VCGDAHPANNIDTRIVRRFDIRNYGRRAILEEFPPKPMFLKILAHPILVNLNFHMPVTVDLSYPLVMLTGENGCGKSTLLHSIHYALRGEEVDGFVYRLESKIEAPKVFLFDAEQHNPRMHLELFENNPQMREFVSMASHGQVMLSMFRETFPALPNGTVLLLDEPEMALSVSNQRRILKMLQELVDEKKFRIICATHSPVLIDAPETYVINLDNYINRNIPSSDMGIEGSSTIQ